VQPGGDCVSIVCSIWYLRPEHWTVDELEQVICISASAPRMLPTTQVHSGLNHAVQGPRTHLPDKVYYWPWISSSAYTPTTCFCVSVLQLASSLPDLARHMLTLATTTSSQFSNPAYMPALSTARAARCMQLTRNLHDMGFLQALALFLSHFVVFTPIPCISVWCSYCS
jgi:hypothetical protein